MEKFWTLREVCIFVRCSESTARRWIAESRCGVGTFPIPIQQKKGGKLLFDPQALVRWVEAQQATPQPAVNPVHSPKREQQDKKRRLELARAALERHRTTTNKKGNNK